MKIAYNPITAAALTAAPNNNDIVFDLRGLNIFAKGIKFKGTDTTYLIFKKHTSTGSGGYNGLVPVPSYTTTNVRYLREDGTWQIPSFHTLTIQTNGTTLGSFNGSTDKTFNITYSDVGAAPVVHTHTSDQIIALTGYKKSTSNSAIATTDSLNTALGKLEYKGDLGVSAYNIVKAAYDGDGTIENLNEILKVLQGISDTDTITGILGQYVTLNTTLTITGSKTFSSLLKSTVATGTAPLSIISTTVNTNLNADLLDGYHSGNFIRNQGMTSTSSTSVDANTVWDNAVKHDYRWSNVPANTIASLLDLSYSPDWRTQIFTVHLAKTVLYVRSRYNGNAWGSWRELAFTDSNVLSASKLFNSQTIWGLPFDGTKPISGNMSSVGNISMSGLILRPGVNASWCIGRDNALIRNTTYTDYNPILSMKTTNGSWELGPYQNDILYLSFISDTDYNAGTNKKTYSILFPKKSGTIALISDIPTATNYYWANIKVSTTSSTNTTPTFGVVTASSFIKTGSSDSYVLLGGGGHKAISDFMLKSDELISNVTTITKTLTVTLTWMDTGIAGSNLATGSYIVLLYHDGNSTDNIWINYYTGVMSWYSNDTNDNKGDEIILHRAGHAYGKILYLRTLLTPTGKGGMKLLIAANTNLAEGTYKFKFKRII